MAILMPEGGPGGPDRKSATQLAPTPIGRLLADWGLLQDVAAGSADPLALPKAGAAYLPPDRRPAAVYLARLGAGSQRAQRGALEALGAILSGGRLSPDLIPWHRLSYQHTAALRAVLAERYKPATANRHLAALRGVLKEAWRLELMEAEAYHRAADVADFPTAGLVAGRALAGGELRSLFAWCADDPTARGRRNAAALALLYGLGLRRAEAVGAQLAEYQGATLRLVGKGGRGRLVYAGPGAAEAIDDWLAVRGLEDGPLLASCSSSGAIVRPMRPIGALRLHQIMAHLAKRAGVTHFTPHDLRRTYTGELLEAGADLHAVQRLLGHASIITTSRYDRRGEAIKRAAADMLPIPYVRPARGGFPGGEHRPDTASAQDS